MHDPKTLREALTGCQAAYYLVHSLDSPDFERKDADAASAFAQAAAAAELQRIVYLGGLGDDDDDLSAHLRSRRGVEQLLGGAGVPVTTLRAGIMSATGVSRGELTRQLVGHLPAMITPRWVRTRTQPIAIDDVVRYLVGVLELPEAADHAYDIGGPEVLEYVTMMRRVAQIQGRKFLVMPVPLLTPQLSSLWGSPRLSVGEVGWSRGPIALSRWRANAEGGVSPAAPLPAPGPEAPGQGMGPVNPSQTLRAERRRDPSLDREPPGRVREGSTGRPGPAPADAPRLRRPRPDRSGPRLVDCGRAQRNPR